jgi:tRNA (cmo5U34)-methyltransferase
MASHRERHPNQCMDRRHFAGTMDKVKEHFQEEASEFDRIIVTLIPEYSQMLEALVSAVPFETNASVSVIDLGCGTGTIAKHLLERFPNARVTCLDLAENMIKMAQAKLADRAGVRYLVGDFSAIDSGESYDAVVSSLALHHIPSDSDKREFYRGIYSCLRPGGVFYNADVVLGSSNFLQALYMRQWRAFMSRGMPEREIDSKWIPKYEAEDRPAKLMDQMTWLAEIGFADVDVIWKYYNFAVYGGRRP